MKILFLYVALFLTGCSDNATIPPPGTTVDAPLGLEQAVKERVAGTKSTFKGMNVRIYPNDTYLVAVDTDRPDSEFDKHPVLRYVAQRAVSNGQPYWQLERATKPLLELRGIK